MPSATAEEQPTPSTQPAPKKRKANPTPTPTHQTTIRSHPWTYFRLLLVTPDTTTPQTSNVDSKTQDIDPLTASPLLTAPLKHHLGLTGAAIPIDILKTSGREVWIRVPAQDGRGVRAAVSAWVGSCEAERVPGSGEGRGKVNVAWRVLGEGVVLGDLVGDGSAVFG